MELLIDIIRLFTISQLLVLVILILRSAIPRTAAWLTTDFCLGLTGYLVLSSGYLDGHWTFYPLLLITVSFPWSFWMMSKVLFDDEFEFKPWMAILVLVVILYNGGLSFTFANELLEQNSQLGVSLRLFSFLISLIFIFMGIVEALKNKEADLIADRRSFRNWFTLTTATVMVLTILTEIAFMSSEPPLFLDLLQKSFILFLVVYFYARRFEFKPGFYPVSEESNTEVSLSPPVDESLVNRLLTAMEDHKIYQKEGLSIGQLADHLEVKEYLLRQTINQHLGYRNFNAFLNDYRVQEACRILADPAQRATTILEIAYALGYNSLAPFNKAFKQQTGMTPTAWRKKELT